MRRARRSTRYLVVCFGVTWSSWWALAVLGGVDAGAAPLLLLGGAGPVVAAIVTTDAVGRRDLVRRALDRERITARWWAAIAVGPALAGTGVVAPFGGADGTAAAGSAALGAVGFALLAGFAEEPGWRGTLLDDVMRCRRTLEAGLQVGAAWAVWHLPLYFAAGTFQHDRGLAWFGVSLVHLPALSVLMTWIHLGTGRSILAAVAVHALGNATGELLPSGGPAAVAQVVLVVVGAAVVAVTLGRASHPAGAR